jgi:hypothetical protein
MEFHGIDEFMRYLKVKFDESERKQDWRALSGRDNISGRYDTYVFTDSRVFQIKAVEVVPQKMAAVAKEVGGSSPDLLDLIKGGAPTPLSVVSRSADLSAVIMFGMQQYSSEISDVLRREYYSSKQDSLKAELDRKVEVMLERPDYRRAYRGLKETQEGYFA